MKKFLLSLVVLLICLCFLFPSVKNASAVVFPQPPTLPFIYNGHTYTDVVAYFHPGPDANGWYDSYSLVYFNSSNNPTIYHPNQNSNLISAPSVASGSNNEMYVHFRCQSDNVPFDTSGTCFQSYGSLQENIMQAGVDVPYQVQYIYDNIWSSKDILRTDNGQVWKSANVARAPQLSVTLDPQTGGTVSSSPTSNFSCSSGTCTGLFTKDSNVSLTPTPSTNWAFAYWIDGANQVTDNPWVVNMSADKSVTAKFRYNMKMPLPGGKHWLLSVEPGGQIQCNGGTDTNHTGTSYYALDFTDNTSEDGHLEGTDVPILAAASGTVTESSCASSSWGCTVVINHGNNLSTRYAHMKTTPLKSQNDTVTTGDQLGVMGNTGDSSGIHLHFQVYYNGDSSSTNATVKSVYLDGSKLDDYTVGCDNFYLSTNQ